MALNKNAMKWVKALRSGTYEQAESVLATPEGQFCCLGVACELAIADGVRVKKRISGEKVFYAKEYEILPDRVRAWLGLDDKRSSFNGGHGTIKQLSQLNDEGESFAAIADVIEKQPDGLFREVPTVKRRGKPDSEKPEKKLP